MNLLSLSYWFNSRPGIPSSLLVKLLGVFILILVILMFVSFLMKNYSKGYYVRIWAKTQTLFLTNLIIGLFLLFFVYESVPFLSSRILLLLWGIGMIVWVGFIYKEATKIPEIKKKKTENKEFNKYIP